MKARGEAAKGRPPWAFGVVAALSFLLMGLGSDRAQAQSPNGFRSPSGNIHCQYIEADADSDAVLRCDLKAIANRPPPRPKDCDLEWGQAFEVFAKKPLTGPICYGDTVMDDRLPVLSYGGRWQQGDFTCRSERDGVRCVNSLGAGFHLSRSAQQVFRGRASGGQSTGGTIR